MASLFRVTPPAELVSRHNVAPTQPILAIWEDQGKRGARFARWGLVPHWVKDPRDFPLLINARAESMAQKPAFRESLKRMRCVVPASGYYEWRADGPRNKQPFYITLTDNAPMALAGLWSSWIGPDGKGIESVATITVAANNQLGMIHDRMPAILRGGEVDAWLDTVNVGSEAAARLARPLEDGAVKFHAVSKRVNSARDDDPGLAEPAVDETVDVSHEQQDQLKLF